MKLLLKKISCTRFSLLKEIYPFSVSKITVLIQKKSFGSFGKGSSITMPSIVEGKKNVFLGENTAIGASTHIWGHGGVRIGNRVLIASHASIVSVTHDPSKHPIRDAKVILKQVTIEDDVWIGSHVVILPGVTIGEGAIVGAETVVTKDVPPFSICVGTPGRVIKQRNIE